MNTVGVRRDLITKIKYLHMKKIISIIIAALLIMSGCKPNGNSGVYEADIVIYGGTSAAVIAAVEATQNGKSVIVVSPDIHPGGLTAGGLGWTDTGKKEVIGGLARDFYHRIWKHYAEDESWKWQEKADYGNKGQGTVAIDGKHRTMWIFEPHAAEKVFEDLLAENDVRMFRDEWLDRENGLVKKDNRIVSFRTLSGKTFAARVFIDATYEGDLMAAAGVSYHVGRESSTSYGEEWNGVQKGVDHHGHMFPHGISPFKTPGDPQSGVLARISTMDPGENGQGDDKIQAYCFRMCMTDHPENRLPFPKPEKYDAAQYELLLRVFDSGWDNWFHKFDPIPNRKTDTNNHGPFSSDNIGMNYDYPEAGYERRQEIIEEHKNYQMGLLWFVANDPRVPEKIRTEMSRWGLAKDEFTDNGNWPHQLYIREARRMVGEYVTTEHDVLLKREVPESVGMGSYTMDSHNVQRYITEEGYVQNEGDLGVKTPAPYSISYRSLTPKREECGNLLVPVCVSSSHIAFGSIRMEPVFMILGQSAGTAACMTVDKDIDVQEIRYEELKPELLKRGQITGLGDLNK